MLQSSKGNEQPANHYSEVLNGRRPKEDRRLILDVMRSESTPERADRHTTPATSGRCKPPAHVFIQSRFVIPLKNKVFRFMEKSTPTRNP